MYALLFFLKILLVNSILYFIITLYPCLIMNYYVSLINYVCKREHWIYTYTPAILLGGIKVDFYLISGFLTI